MNRRRTLRSIEPILREDNQTRCELDRVSGLSGILTLSGDQTLERNSLPRFINLQTSFFVDRVTQGDILRTFTLQTIYDQSDNNNTILTAIARSLDDCCATIQGQIKDLLDLITDKFRSLGDLIIRKFLALDNTLTLLKQDLRSKIELESVKLFDQVNRRADANQELINETNRFVQNKVDGKANQLETLINTSFSGLSFQIDNDFINLYDKLNTSFQSLTNYI